MEKIHTTRVLGSAEYEARWIGNSMAVLLSASGVLPCSNFLAQLERRGARITPAIWELIFYMPVEFDGILKPFRAEAIVINTKKDKNLIVIDAMGEHLVPIQASDSGSTDDTLSDAAESDGFEVFARSTQVGSGTSMCFTVPVGTAVLPLYYRAFGPATKEACSNFVLATRQTRVSLCSGLVEGLKKSISKDD